MESLDEKKTLSKSYWDYCFDLFTQPVLSDFFRLAKKKSSARKDAKLSYKSFEIKNFKGIDHVSIDLIKNNLVLLLGLNESGKSTILKAIEAFDYLNDPTQEDDEKYFQNIRNKSQVSSNKDVVLTARISIEQPIPELQTQKNAERQLSNDEKIEINEFINKINSDGEVYISRVFPFKSGKLSKYHYRIESKHPFSNNLLSRQVAAEIVSICPYIIYFEDFKDRIPEKIFVTEKSDAFDSSWFDIINGLFFNTDEELSIEEFKKYYSKNNKRPDDARTVLKRVNKKLNETFTKKWKDLSGVKDIDSAELIYENKQSPHFILKITDSDGTTYSIDERSRGALWYLSFLMKTEFRSKRLRNDHGKPVFLIDEPASNLHSNAQQNMTEDFGRLAENTSLIYTTHSQYLISLHNIKNTYIVERKNGLVVASRWSEFIQRPENKRPVSYYQPLANLLNIIPTTFDVPWKKCLITEGPSDRHILYTMYYAIYAVKPDFVIYPGTSANDLDNLIALNIGWNADFRIVLDSDKKGIEQQKRYIDKFNLSDNQIMTLPLQNGDIEDCFEESELNDVYSLAVGNDPKTQLSKKEISAAFSILSSREDLLKKMVRQNVFHVKTLNIFKTIFNTLSNHKK